MFIIAVKYVLFQVRILGEDPVNDFLPSPGTLGEVVWPQSKDGLRIDTWIYSGIEVSIVVCIPSLKLSKTTHALIA